MERLNDYHNQDLTTDDSLEAYHQRQADAELAQRVNYSSRKLQMLEALDSGKVAQLVSRQQHDILVKLFKEGKTPLEIANDLGMEHKNISIQMTRAIQSIQGKL